MESFFIIQKITSQNSAFASIVGKVRDNFRGGKERLADFPCKELNSDIDVD